MDCSFIRSIVMFAMFKNKIKWGGGRGGIDHSLEKYHEKMPYVQLIGRRSLQAGQIVDGNRLKV